MSKDEKDYHSELERYAKTQGMFELYREALRQIRILPCSYDGSDCLFSYLARGSKESGTFIAAYCLRARQIRRGIFTSISQIEKRLEDVGCPEPRHNFFFGWRCKYADGKCHRL